MKVLDKGGFRAELDLPHEETIYLLLIDRAERSCGEALVRTIRISRLR